MSDINSRQSSELIESKYNAVTGSDKEPLRKVAYFILPVLLPSLEEAVLSQILLRVYMQWRRMKAPVISVQNLDTIPVTDCFF